LVDGEKPAFDWFSETERYKDNIRSAGTKISMCWRKLGSDDKKVKKAKAGLEFGHLRNKRPNNKTLVSIQFSLRIPLVRGWLAKILLDKTRLLLNGNVYFASERATLTDTVRAREH
jgi:hypothetical protein